MRAASPESTHIPLSVPSSIPTSETSQAKRLTLWIGDGNTRICQKMALQGSVCLKDCSQRGLSHCSPTSASVGSALSPPPNVWGREASERRGNEGNACKRVLWGQGTGKGAGPGARSSHLLCDPGHPGLSVPASTMSEVPWTTDSQTPEKPLSPLGTWGAGSRVEWDCKFLASFQGASDTARALAQLSQCGIQCLGTVPRGAWAGPSRDQGPGAVPQTPSTTVGTFPF